MSRSTMTAVAGGLVLAWASGAWAQFVFVEVGAERGIQPSMTDPGKGSSAVAADFDNDGDVDLFIPNAGGVADQLYRNLGDGTFEEIGEAAGVASTARSRVGLFFDYDGDTLLDLMVAGDCWAGFGFPIDPACPITSTLHLYRQVSEGQFEDVTVAAGITDDLIESSNPHRGGMAAGDIDNDGYLDLVIGTWQGESRLFHNQGDGTFVDIRMSSGLGGVIAGWWQPMFHDFNDDGWMDIYHAVDFTGNRFWINQADYLFSDVAGATQTNNAWNDMGMNLGDYDNDGDLDVYVTNITNSARHNVLFRNDSTKAGLAFEEISQLLGVDSGGWGWGCTFFDANRDGYLDLAATNGWFNGGATGDTSRFFLNTGVAPYAFLDLSNIVGFNDALWGSTVIAVDVDRDGDEDLIQSCNGSGTTAHMIRILDNQPMGAAADNNYLVVKPRMDGPNHRAIGALVRATAGSLQMTRLISAGMSFYGQQPAEAFFGLGTAETVDTVTVEWPDGTVTQINDVDVNQVITIDNVLVVEGDVTGDGMVNVSDLLQVIVDWGPCGDPCPSDTNGDGIVNVTDLVTVIVNWGG